MKWNFRNVLIAFALLIACTPVFSQTDHVISGLESAKHYKSKSTGKLYIRTGSFANQGNAIRYEAYIAANTKYPVRLTHQNRYYVVTIGPIGSASEVRRVATSIHPQMNHGRIKAAVRKREFMHLADNESSMGNTPQSVKAANAIKSVKTKQAVTPSATAKTKSGKIKNTKAVPVTTSPVQAPANTPVNTLIPGVAKPAPAATTPSAMPVPVPVPVAAPASVAKVTPSIPVKKPKVVKSSKPAQKHVNKIKQSKPVMTPEVAAPITKKPVRNENHEIIIKRDADINDVTLKSLVEQPSEMVSSSSGFTQANWLISVDVGEQFPFYNNSANVNNGSGAPAPYNNDIYTTRKDNEPFIGISAGRRWMREDSWFPSVTGMLTYQHLFAINPGGQIIQYSDPAFNNYNYNLNIASEVLLAEVKLNVYEYAKISPFITGGLGAVFNRSNDYSEYAHTGVTPRVTPGYATNSSIQFSYGIGAGLDYQLTPAVLLSLEYRYLSLGTINSGHGSGSWSNETLNLGSYHTNTVQLSLGYLFGN